MQKDAPIPTASPGSINHSTARSWILRFCTILTLSAIILYSYASSSAKLEILTLNMSTLYTEPPRAHVKELAASITAYYELLAKMRYFPSSSITYPPHSPPIDLQVCEELGLEPQVIELLQTLPYVEGYNNEDEFILGSSFADYRDAGVLRQSRDPGYASPEGGFDHENGEYVRPWVLALAECGNHGSIIYADTRNGHITMEGQDSGISTDPVFEKHADRSRRDPVNRNSIEYLPSRPGKDLLEDFMNRLMTLEWIPAVIVMPKILQEYDDEYEDMKLLFTTYGWPENFDGPAFDDAFGRWVEFDSVRGMALTRPHELTEAERKLKYAEHVLQQSSQTQDQLRYNKEQVEKAKEDVKKASEAMNEWEGEQKEIVKAWRIYFQEKIQHAVRDLEWLEGDGKGYANEQELQVLRSDVAEWNKKIKDAETLPLTLEDAIKPRAL